jgi:uncharacterized protein (TIGR03437 family)
MQAFSRSILILTLALFPAGAADFHAGTVPAVLLHSLPSGAFLTGLAADPQGNVLVCGGIVRPGGDSSGYDAFAAKLQSDGQTLVYFRLLAGSGFDQATAIAVDPDGNAYVAGDTESQDFPTTGGAWQTANYPGALTAFVVKLDPAGKLIYSTLAGGKDYAVPWSIAVNGAGEAFITGQTTGGDFPLSGGIRSSFPGNSFFLVRLSAAGDRPIYSITGPGGLALAIDEQNNAYTAGDAQSYQIPITPHALQTSVGSTACGGGAQLQIPCNHQYVCKVDATGSTLLFCTLISGTGGESYPSIAVDSLHEIYVTGTTQATDYPVTAGALQPSNHSLLPPPPINPPSYPGQYFAFQPTGYFSKLSADGSHLLYSTYLGGSNGDFPQGLALDSQGNAYIASTVASPDYPGLPAAPQRCLPDRLHAMPVLTRLDGSGAHSAVVEVNISAPRNQAGALLAAGPQTGFWIGGAGPYLNRIGLDGAPAAGPVSCITDAVDFSQAGPIAPGQLLTAFGAFPDGATVQVNGESALIFYASANQINFQAPESVVGQQVADIAVAGVHHSVPAAALNPSLLTAGKDAYPLCKEQTVLDGFSEATYAQALNEDGTVNSCENPAAPGSQVEVVLNGAGTVAPSVTDHAGNTVSAVSAIEGLAGAWLVKVRMPPGKPAYTMLRLYVNGAAVRQQSVPIWLR